VVKNYLGVIEMIGKERNEMGLGYEEEQRNDTVVCGMCGVGYSIRESECPYCKNRESDKERDKERSKVK